MIFKLHHLGHLFQKNTPYSNLQVQQDEFHSHQKIFFDMKTTTQIKWSMQLLGISQDCTMHIGS